MYYNTLVLSKDVPTRYLKKIVYLFKKQVDINVHIHTPSWHTLRKGIRILYAMHVHFLLGVEPRYYGGEPIAAQRFPTTRMLMYNTCLCTDFLTRCHSQSEYAYPLPCCCWTTRT